MVWYGTMTSADSMDYDTTSTTSLQGQIAGSSVMTPSKVSSSDGAASTVPTDDGTASTCRSSPSSSSVDCWLLGDSTTDKDGTGSASTSATNASVTHPWYSSRTVTNASTTSTSSRCKSMADGDVFAAACTIMGASPSTPSTGDIAPTTHWINGGSGISKRRHPLLSRAKSENSAIATPSLRGKSSEAMSNNASSSSAINDAARVCGWTDVQELCRDYPLDAAYRDSDGWTALHHACNRRPPASVIQALTQAYPDAVFWPDKTKGMTPLHYACRFKASKEVVQILIDAAQRSDNVSHAKHLPPPQWASAICSFPCKRGRTPLWYALRYDAPDGIMELLLVHYPLAGIMVDHMEESPLKYIWDRTITKLGKRGLAIVHKVISSASEDQQNQSSKVPQSVDILQNLSLSKDKHVKDLYNAYLKAVTMIQAAYRAFCEEEECQGTANTDLFQNILHALARLGGCHIHPTLWDITTSIFSSQASQKDRHGNLPLHYVLAPCTICAHVAERRQHQLLQITNSPSSGKLEEEFTSSLSSLSPSLIINTTSSSTATTPTVTVLSAKSVALTLLTLYPEAASIPDSTGRYPLHIALHCNNVGYHQQQTGTVCCIKEKFDWNDGYSHGKVFSNTTEGLKFGEDGNAVEDPVRQHCCGEGVIGKLVKCYPEALYKVDSRTGLFPFMMAATHSCHSTGSSTSEVECDTLNNEAQLFSTGLVFDLLLESPGLLQTSASS